jgi:hypothetical protein
MSPRSSKPKKAKGKASRSSANKPPVDAYTGLLFAGFLAVVVGCALLAVELGKYDWALAS